MKSYRFYVEAICAFFLLWIVACGRLSSTPVAADAQAENIAGGLGDTIPDKIRKSTVLIFTYDVSSARTTFQCSGVILTEDLIMTAAHCLEPARSKGKNVFGPNRSAFVYLGELGSKPKFEVAKIIPIDRFEIHPAYKVANDLAMVHLTIPLDLELTPPTLFKGILGVGTKVVSAGFGPPIEGSKDLSRSLRIRSSSITSPSSNDSNVEAEIQCSHNHSMTSGDSGGPSFVKGKNGEWELWGIYSAGISINGACVSDVYESLLKQSDWISRAMTELSNKPSKTSNETTNTL